MSGPRIATQDQIDEACMTRGANEAARFLISEGFLTTESRCATAISKLISQGLREPRSKSARSIQVVRANDEASYKVNCEALLRAHLRSGQHWITDDRQFRNTCAVAGLVA